MLPGDNIVGDDHDKLADHLTTQLLEWTLEGKWKKVAEMYEKYKEAHTTDIIKSRNMGTALHVAIKFNEEDIVRRLVKAIIEHGEKGPNDIPTALVKRDERGHTPLHLAASRDFPRLCKCVVGDVNNRMVDLVTKKDNQGETPLFAAARNGSKAAFAYLYHISLAIVVPMRDLVRGDGDSILHVAIRKELFDLAVIIVDCYPALATYANAKDGSTPLKVLATRPLAFRSGSSLSWWSLLLYNTIPVEPLDAKRTINKLLEGQDGIGRRCSKFPVNYDTICGYRKLFIETTFGKLKKDPHDTEDPPMRSEAGFFPPNYATCQQFFSSAYVHAFRLVGVDFDEIRRTKKKHTWSCQLLDALMEHAYDAYTGRGDQPRDMSVDPDIKEMNPETTKPDQEKDSTAETAKSDKARDSDSNDTPLSLAARNGTCEMVTEIISKLPSTVHEKNSQRENVLLVPVLYRQPNLLETLKEKAAPEVGSSLTLAEDEKENTMQMAAKAQGDEKHKQIAGSALQMMWDIKWYEVAGFLTLTTKPDKAKDPDSSDETPLLLAARNGICEMVTEIISKLPSTVHEKNSRRENVLLVAVLYRQPDVLETLKKIAAPEVWHTFILAEDKEENTMLHLAAKAQDDEKHRQIAGSALQMMWDIKWYEYIKSLMPKHCYFRSNINKETARDIFKRTHGPLIKDSNEWLKDTSESCSVVAALVAGLSFATAATVPGGNDDNGKPPLEGKPAFDAFAISSLVGLCFSATGLIMFLTILTSRKEARDFQRGLPMKLFLGLSSLFLSIVAMFVSFCSGHFFNINHKYKDILLPVYAATSLPVAFYAFAQFPLYNDLLTTIFGKVPLAKDKGDTL